MKLYFVDIHNEKITEYKTIYPVIPICFIIELDDLTLQSYNGTIYINDVPFADVSQPIKSSSVINFKTTIDNLFYRFTSNKNTTFEIKAIVTVTSGSVITSHSASFTAKYIHDIYTVEGLFGNFYNNVSDILPNTISNISNFNKTRSIHKNILQILGNLSGSVNIHKNINFYIRETQYIQHLINKYRNPYLNNDYFTLANKIYYIAKNTNVSTTISVDSLLRDQTVPTLILDNIYSKIHCNVEKVLVGGEIVGITVTPTDITAKDVSCILCIKDTNTNTSLYMSVIFILQLVPPIRAADLVVTVTQGETVTTTFNEILSQSYGDNLSFVGLINDSTVNGITTVDTTNKFITFKSTGLTGDKAGYRYEIKDNNGFKSIGNVQCVVQRLPNIEAYFYTSLAEAQQFMNTHIPPSLADVFNSWNRFSNGNKYYPSGTTPAGEAASWKMISANQFACTVNSIVILLVLYLLKNILIIHMK